MPKGTIGSRLKQNIAFMLCVGLVVSTFVESAIAAPKRPTPPPRRPRVISSGPQRPAPTPPARFAAGRARSASLPTKLSAKATSKPPTAIRSATASRPRTTSNANNRTLAALARSKPLPATPKSLSTLDSLSARRVQSGRRSPSATPADPGDRRVGLTLPKTRPPRQNLSAFRARSASAPPSLKESLASLARRKPVPAKPRQQYDRLPDSAFADPNAGRSAAKPTTVNPREHYQRISASYKKPAVATQRLSTVDPNSGKNAMKAWNAAPTVSRVSVGQLGFKPPRVISGAEPSAGPTAPPRPQFIDVFAPPAVKARSIPLEQAQKLFGAKPAGNFTP
jgi:hypothetical protein